MSIHQKDMHGFSFDGNSGAVVIPLPEEFSYDETLHYLTRSPAECLHHVEGRKVYKLLELEGAPDPVLVEICEGDGPFLSLRFVDGAPQGGAGAMGTAVKYVREWFDLDTDLTAFYRMAEGDPLLGKLVTDYRGLRIIGVPDLFEALCWAVIGQQINLAFAYTLKKRFIEAFGKQVEWNGRTYGVFPKPQDIPDDAAEELKQLQFTGKKAEYVTGIARLMESGELTKASLLGAGDFGEAERRLTSVRGIGPWTAHYVQMRCLRDRAAFPIGDAALQNALKLLLGRAEKPSPEEIRHVFAPWRGWEAYAVFYLWRSLVPAAPAPAGQDEV